MSLVPYLWITGSLINGHNNATFGPWLGTNIVKGPIEHDSPIWINPAAGPGNGYASSAWLDNWCDYSPLVIVLSARQIRNAGFQMSSKVVNDAWSWPAEWGSKFRNITVPDLSF
ncbi:hypothetical protein Tco_0323455 [Tanacetum coccineum]